MKFLFILTLLSSTVFAQEIQKSDEHKIVAIEQFCTGPRVSIHGMNLVIDDKGFCKALAEIKKENKEVDVDFVSDITSVLHQIRNFSTISNFCPETMGNFQFGENVKKDKWKVRFYASHSFTTYFSTDMKIRSSRYNIDIDNYEWKERSSRHFFNPETWKEEGNNPFQVIDEPTNTFTLSIEKNGNEFFLSAFHPKFLQNDGQVKHVRGEVDGVPVDGMSMLESSNGGMNPADGQLGIIRNQNTHLEMMFEVGYGHRFKLLDGKAGSLVYIPSLAVGVTYGKNLTVVVKEGELWNYEDTLDKAGIQGVGGTVTNRIEFNTKKERFGVFYENRFSYYKQKHGYMDGTQQYDLKLMGNSVGIKFMIFQ
ncbi:MAG: hypothetical protein HN576_00765 [Bacteriovoracaceae bacterium]|jgi:hypothetical protein|nr:hypothetical protein [Bacteriovoracaceae bacterium]